MSGREAACGEATRGSTKRGRTRAQRISDDGAQRVRRREWVRSSSLERGKAYTWPEYDGSVRLSV